MDIKNLQKDTVMLDKDLMDKWNNVAPVLRNKHVNQVVEIEGGVAYKYRYDFTGLLLSMDVPEELIYVHTLVNGYGCSTEYLGYNTSIKILDYNEANIYLDLFTN